MTDEDSPPEELPQSDQIIYDNPTRSSDEANEKAVALEYEESEDEAPRVTAKGEGKMAEKIIQLAEQEDIPLYEDRDLVDLLYTLDLDQQIPPSLYEVVAEVFAFIYRLNDQQKDVPGMEDEQ